MIKDGGEMVLLKCRCGDYEYIVEAAVDVAAFLRKHVGAGWQIDKEAVAAAPISADERSGTEIRLSGKCPSCVAFGDVPVFPISDFSAAMKKRV